MYAFSLGNGSDCRLFSHTGDVIHVFGHCKRGIRTHMDAATSPSIAMYVVSTYCATETSPKGSSNSTAKDYGHHSTLRIGVHMYFVLYYFMHYAFSLGNGSDCRLISHTGDIIHVFVHDERGIRTRTDAAISPSIAKYVVSTYCATETSPNNDLK